MNETCLMSANSCFRMVFSASWRFLYRMTRVFFEYVVLFLIWALGFRAEMSL